MPRATTRGRAALHPRARKAGWTPVKILGRNFLLGTVPWRLVSGRQEAAAIN